MRASLPVSGRTSLTASLLSTSRCAWGQTLHMLSVIAQDLRQCMLQLFGSSGAKDGHAK